LGIGDQRRRPSLNQVELAARGSAQVAEGGGERINVW
jgi:hypothetical protein